MSNMYSQCVPHTGSSSSTLIRRTHKSDLIGKLSWKGSLTLYESFCKSAKQNLYRRCLGQRPVDTLNGTAGLFLFRTYAEILRSIRCTASGLVKEGLIMPNSDGLLALGIYMKNCSAWIVAENACYYLNAVVVPLYDTLGPDTIEFIVNQTGLQTIVCSSKELASLAAVAHKCPTLRAVVVTDLSVPHTVCSQVMKAANIQVVSLHDLERIGDAYPTDPRPPQPTDIATICYTSGTTGKPKGALISHQNLISVMSAGLEGVIFARKEDLYLSFLPLPHIFERLVVSSLLGCGAAIGFYRGDILKVVEDVIALRPTIFCAVPRLYTRIHDKFQGKVDSEIGLTGYLLRTALSSKLKLLREKGVTKHSTWDGLIFNKAKKAMGMQDVRLMISGGAPLPARTMEFFRVLLGGDCTCHEGYGMTETTGATCVTYPDDLTLGQVGGPFPCCEIKLVDVPEMGYLHSDRMHNDSIPCEGRGEIWVRGSGVIKGYYKDEEETAAAGLNDPQGWLRSGDIGMWTPKGQLSIIDRKKNMFKLSQGEYIAVEKIEGILGQASLVSQLFIHGDSTEDKLVAVVVPDEDVVGAWKKSMKTLLSPSTSSSSPSTSSSSSSTSYTSSTSSSSSSSSSTVSTHLKPSDNNSGGDVQGRGFDSDLESATLSQLREVGVQNGLKGYEQVHAVTIERQPWTPESGHLTPTMKFKRVALRSKYEADFKRMYAQLNSVTRPLPRL